MLTEAERKLGVWTISAATPARACLCGAPGGVPCTVVAIETAPASKIERMRALGAKLVLVPYDAAWEALGARAYPGVEGTFVHPFDDHNFIAGHATMGLEILEDAPDVAAVICGVGGGGLVTGVGSAVKALRPEVRSGPPSRTPPRRPPARRHGLAAAVFRSGRPRSSTGRAGTASSAHVGADEAAGRRLDRRHLDQTRRAMRLMAEKARVIAEGAAPCPWPRP